MAFAPKVKARTPLRQAFRATVFNPVTPASPGPVWSISSPSASPPLASPSSGSPLGSAESGAVWPSAVAQTVPTAIITGKVLQQASSPPSKEEGSCKSEASRNDDLKARQQEAIKKLLSLMGSVQPVTEKLNGVKTALNDCRDPKEMIGIVAIAMHQDIQYRMTQFIKRLGCLLAAVLVLAIAWTLVPETEFQRHLQPV